MLFLSVVKATGYCKKGTIEEVIVMNSYFFTTEIYQTSMAITRRCCPLSGLVFLVLPILKYMHIKGIANLYDDIWKFEENNC